MEDQSVRCLGGRVPRPFDDFGFVLRGRWFDGRLERVGFAGEVAFAFIFNLSASVIKMLLL